MDLLPLLRDLLDNGAASYGEVEGRIHGDCSVRDLVAMGFLAAVPTKYGTAFVLGPRGKKILGVNSSWITRPGTAGRQLLMRAVHSHLTASGWKPLGGGALPHPRYLGPDGRTAYVLVAADGPKSRSVRRTLAHYRTHLIREGAVLLVFSARWRRLRHLEDDWNGLVRVCPLPPAAGPAL